MLGKTRNEYSSSYQPNRRPSLRESLLDGEGLVFDEETNSTHHLNSTALFIWNQCDGNTSIQCIAERVADTYDLTAKEALDEVSRLVGYLEERRLIHSREDAPKEDVKSC